MIVNIILVNVNHALLMLSVFQDIVVNTKKVGLKSVELKVTFIITDIYVILRDGLMKKLLI